MDQTEPSYDNYESSFKEIKTTHYLFEKEKDFDFDLRRP